MTPDLTFPLTTLNFRAVEFTRVGTNTSVIITPDRAELWQIYAIQDNDGSTNTFHVNFTPKGGAGTWKVFNQATASAVPVATPNMPALRQGDTMTVVGSVAANYLVLVQTIPLP